MKSSSAPAAPDPVATANAQTASNKETAAYQAQLNLINQNTPLGSIKYTNVGTADSPQYQSDTTLTPVGQESFDLQQQVGNALDKLALQGTGQVSSALATSQDYSSLPAPKGIDTSTLPSLSKFDTSSLGAVPTADEAARQKAEDAIYGLNTATLDPQYQKAQTELETQLTNAGMQRGTPAWNQAMQQFGLTKNQAYQGARNTAIAGASDYQTQQLQDALATRNQGLTEMTDQYGNSLTTRQQGLSEQQTANATDLTNRQQGVSEANYLRELPINEVSALLNGGQVQIPTFPTPGVTAVQPTNTAGITQSAYQDQLAAWQQTNANNNSMLGSLAGLGGSILGAWISDRRMKTNIRRVGTTDNGLPVYTFNYVFGGPVQMGVMAQEVELVDPSAVIERNGVKFVNYAAVR